ncbi:beta-lactamase class A [Enterococcus sp. PF1-24]|uniref:serine hydrolase n=1 Tax=unclassified Enterococcus TaxID=2608891 RepID=UPI0024753B37|nr:MULTISPECIES: serine hydrolase [unclassified Enterococcus]MDH6364112.1 beta-lactamase class A [Enterococcus sp. PFB1-1]MDH6401213.1 beta-lactamase class A [Enterococcus sp. PF1-24]
MKKGKEIILAITAFLAIVCGTVLILSLVIKKPTATASSAETTQYSSSATVTATSSNSYSEMPTETTLEESLQSSSAEITSSSEEVEMMLPQTEISGANLFANANQVSYGIYYFSDGQFITNSGSMPMVSASVIKVFIMDYLYENGVDMQASAGGESLASLTRRMIQVSDNGATNTLIDYIGMSTLNSYFQQAGYWDTRLERKMLDDNARNNGLDNYTSLNDTMTFLKKVYLNQGSYPYNQMLSIMEGQQINTKLSSQLPANVGVANKTGELPNIENDIGLVLDGENSFAIVVLSDGVTNVSGMRQAIGEFALNAWQMKQ